MGCTKLWYIPLTWRSLVDGLTPSVAPSTLLTIHTSDCFTHPHPQTFTLWWLTYGDHHIHKATGCSYAVVIQGVQEMCLKTKHSWDLEIYLWEELQARDSRGDKKRTRIHTGTYLHIHSHQYTHTSTRVRARPHTHTHTHRYT